MAEGPAAVAPPAARQYAPVSWAAIEEIHWLSPRAALSLGACAAEGSAAATREKTVQFGITTCAQGSTLGLSVLHKLSSFFARFASPPSAAQAPRVLVKRIDCVLLADPAALLDEFTERACRG